MGHRAAIGTLSACAHAEEEMMARQSNTTDQAAPSRREEILAIAGKVIAERGIAGATVRDIGQAAGILSGSLYHHFESKEQIVLELLLPSVEAHHQACVAILATASSSVRALEELLRASVEQAATHPNQSIILRNEASTFRDVALLEPLAELRRKSLALWTGLLNKGVEAGEFRQDIDIDVAVHAMFDGVLGVSRWFRGDNSSTPKAIAETLIEMYVDGLRRR
jgi:TetR/AcrR family transcriptional regulator, cholesterol catabolism regulator